MTTGTETPHHEAEPSAFGLTAPAWISLALIVVMVILGGMGSIPGAILGATVVTVLNLQVLKGLSLWLNELRNAGTTIFGWSLTNWPTQLEPAKYERMVFGLILVLMMIFRPQGILPARRRQRELTDGSSEPR